MRIAIIPARGGSKRIPQKNIKPFCGFPIIAWSIRAALRSECFDRVLVSTDNEDIAQIAQVHGAEVPFRRPSELSDDHTATTPVIAHAIEWHHRTSGSTTEACCIYPTAPFVQPGDLQEGLRRLTESDADYVVSVTRFSYPIQRALYLSADLRVHMFQPEHFQTRSQDLTEAWHDAGQFYWGTSDAWLQQRPLFSARTQAVPLPSHRVQDIDTMEDWVRAEWMFKALQDQATAS